MLKVDHKRELRHLYNPPAKIAVVEVPPMNFLMIDGQGDPNTALAYREAIEALFAVSYALKFKVKKSGGFDYTVMPLEGLWWAADMDSFTRRDKSAWSWTAMIMQPDFMTTDEVDIVLADWKRKKSLAMLDRLRFEHFHEGEAVQTMYTGAFDNEGSTIESMHHFITDSGWAISGKHHEIYLSDFRRTAPEKLKTVIRQPFHRNG